MKIAIFTAAVMALSLSFTEAGSCSSGKDLLKKVIDSAPSPIKKKYTPKKSSSSSKSSCEPKAAPRHEPKRTSSHEPKCAPSYERKSTPSYEPKCTSSYEPKITYCEKPVVNIGSELMDPREDFLRRLALAPAGYDCGYPAINANIGSLSGAAHSACQVSMLGKVEYEWGNSSLGYEARQAIESAILRARAEHGPNLEIVVFGYADKTGKAAANLRLSDIRAANVARHIDQLNWAHGLQLKTTSIAMGEKVELCSHDYDHNRVAEIWMIEFPRVLTKTYQVTSVPVVSAPQAQIIQAPLQNVVTNYPRVAVSNPVVTQLAPQPAGFVQIPTATADPLAGLITFLQQNTVLSPNADPNELAMRLAALRTMGR